MFRTFGNPRDGILTASSRLMTNFRRRPTAQVTTTKRLESRRGLWSEPLVQSLIAYCSPRASGASISRVESCLTTFSSYGIIPPARQAEIIRRLADRRLPPDKQSTAEMLRYLAEKMERDEPVD